MKVSTLLANANTLFRYRDGKLYYRMDKTRAGRLCTISGYRQVYVGGKSYQEHRLIFLMHHRYLPKIIDHINGIKDDNHIHNLRACTHSQNMHNQKKAKNNTSGVKGVYWNKRASKWCAQIKCNRVNHYLGLFEDLELAELVVMEARDVLHNNFARHI